MVRYFFTYSIAADNGNPLSTDTIRSSISSFNKLFQCDWLWTIWFWSSKSGSIWFWSPFRKQSSSMFYYSSTSYSIHKLNEWFHFSVKLHSVKHDVKLSNILSTKISLSFKMSPSMSLLLMTSMRKKIIGFNKLFSHELTYYHAVSLDL